MSQTDQSDRRPYRLMGRLIGTYRAWDDAGEDQCVLYDFRPAFEANCPIGDVLIDWSNGLIIKYDPDSGDEIERADLLAIVNGAPQ